MLAPSPRSEVTWTDLLPRSYIRGFPTKIFVWKSIAKIYIYMPLTTKYYKHQVSQRIETADNSRSKNVTAFEDLEVYIYKYICVYIIYLVLYICTCICISIFT